MKRILLVVLLAFVSHETFATNYRYTVPAADIDSARTYFLKNTIQAKTWVTTTSIDTNISYFEAPDTFYQAFTLTYYQGSVNPALGYWGFGLGATNSTWRLPFYSQDSVTICTLFVYANGSLASTSIKSNFYSWDTTIPIAFGNLYDAKFSAHIYTDTSVTTFSRNTDSLAAIEVNPMVGDSLERAFVYGNLFTRSGVPVYGAIIEAIGRTGTNNPVIISTDTFLTIPNPIDTTTDTLGFFGFGLIRSTNYASYGATPSKPVYYDFRGTVAGNLVWELKKVLIPDTGAQFNLGNLTAQRVQ